MGMMKEEKSELIPRSLFIASGRKGGTKTKERHGTAHYQRMAEASRKARSKKRELK